MKGCFTFFWQFCTAFQTTGAVAPSSAALSRRLASKIRADNRDPDVPVKVFEAGPGTGVATRQVLKRLMPKDRLVIYEANETFVEYLRAKFDGDPEFAPYKEQVELVQGFAQACEETDFDHAVCGIPFTNFDAATVQSILDSLMARLKPGGTLSFFEYWGIRRFRNFFARRTTRERLRAVDAVTDGFEHAYGTGEEIVFLNLPPAAAKHCMKPAESA
jgi:phospholipid N-methyltransferase